MRNVFLAGLSVLAVALGGCAMEQASASGNPAADLPSPADAQPSTVTGHRQSGPQSPADVANEIYYGSDHGGVGVLSIPR